MKKIDKAVQMEVKTLEERIVGKKCPHDYGMTDWATSNNSTCSFGCDCKACWGEEVEDDET